MKKFIEHFTDEQISFLRRQLLFSGLSEHEIFMFVHYSNPFYRKINGGEILRVPHDKVHMIGLVFGGQAYIYSVDYEGNRTLIKSFQKGETSGTLYSMLDYHNTLMEIEAKDECELLFINPETIFIADGSVAVIQQKILVNLLASQREIFFDLSEHLACLSQRSIRDKLLKYLKSCSEKEHSYNFTIPFSREELANYLAVDRASLSRALGEMKNDGIIDFHKNHFTILTTKYFKYQ